MKLAEIYQKDIHRNIEGVIKADDDKHLAHEIDEYIITNEISARLAEFLGAYSHKDGSNGAWISGFYGSGKSHLLKMLSFLLEGKQVNGLSVMDAFLDKVDDAILKADIKKLANIPSKSMLFNIDQKATVVSKDKNKKLLHVFAKVFDDMCGYFGKQGYVASFERDLDQKGLLEDFKKSFEAKAGKPWEKGREHGSFETKHIDAAFSEVVGTEAGSNVLATYSKDYSLSIEDFANQVNDYIQTQDKNFRLNFFVDEVGQFIADDVKLMTNLQTIAESLNTKCAGRAWIVVTSQEDMDNIVGQMNANQSNDFSKIQARFQHRLKLTSQNAADVIQRRLLAKTLVAETQLQELYQEHGANFRTILSFSDGSRNYRNFEDEDHFVRAYPFIPYQFELFKTATEELSRYSHFEGSHASIGERTLLSVFQQVARYMADQELGKLATFDSMFEGIKKTLKSQVITSITKAETQLTNDLAKRVLKALYLVKYVKEFKPTLRNICVLMHDSVDADTDSIRSDIENALQLLVKDTYIRRSGDYYEYLTNEERDVEEEIKQIELDPDSQAKELLDIVFNNIIGSADRKIGLVAGDQQYNYSKKLDDSVHGGREYELSINIISPFHDRAGDLTTLRSNNMGKDELLVILNPEGDKQLFPELTRYLKTQKYIKQNRGNFDDAQPQKARILAEKGNQLDALKAELRERVRGLVGTADFMAGGNDISVGGSDAKSRMIEGFQQLITRTYTNLRMLKGVVYSDRELANIIERENDLLGSDAEPLSEAEKDVFSLITLRESSTERPTVKMIVDHYGKKPFGWSMAAALAQIANLCMRGQIEASLDSNSLEGKALVEALKNTQKQQQTNLRKQQEYDAASIRKLRKFFENMFDQPPRKSDPRGLGEETADEMRHLKSDVESIIAMQQQYPFVAALTSANSELTEHVGKPHDYYLQNIEILNDRLLNLKDELISPIRDAVKGDKGRIYQEAKGFASRYGADLETIDRAGLERLREKLNDVQAYKGQNIRAIESLQKALKKNLDDAIQKAHLASETKLKELQEAFQNQSAYLSLEEKDQSTFIDQFGTAKSRLEDLGSVAAIGSVTESFTDFEYTGMLKELAKEVARQKGEDVTKIEIVNLRELLSNTGQVLRSEQDVKSYLEGLESALMKAIKDGKQVRP